ncbi:hypothetical protein CRG98_008488 [Punica granatum]|uniref:Uncharacterized protein n=1 Tax=Punica granatum TaxID=22663 RepID=A0A2I0KS10_PUNGR|nr:hypothetical protein CRG98_008488 [Punica granatum]
MKLLRRCLAPGVAVCLICRKPALLLGRLLVALPGKKIFETHALQFRVAVKSLYLSDANGGLAFRSLNAKPPGLLLALHGYIETFSKVPSGSIGCSTRP